MKEFLFLYRGGEPEGSPQEMQAHMQKWVNWMKELGAKGHLKDIGNPLDGGGKLVSGKKKTVTDGPYAEKDIVGGYSLILAKDIAEAAEVSKGCPIFEFAGGTVEVRPILNMM